MLEKKDTMSEIQNLLEVSEETQLKFVDGFDHVLADLDGVVKLGDTLIPGAKDCLNKLKKLGKSVSYVSNNALANPEEFHQKLLNLGLDIDIHNIFIPQMAVLDYLQQINYKKKIFVLATDSYKNYLRKAGFRVVEDPPVTILESLPTLASVIKDDPDVEIVLVDFDFNLSLVKLTQAAYYLSKPNCTFLTGGADKILPLSKEKSIIGLYYMHRILEDYSGKKPITLAKPSKHYNKFIQERLKLTNPNRVLFIGDSITEDMGFATINDYQKLLVLTGNTKIENILNWTNPKEYKPDYYLNGLQELSNLLQKLKSV